MRFRCCNEPRLSGLWTRTTSGCSQCSRASEGGVMSDVNQIGLYEPSMTIGTEKDLLRAHLRLVQQALLWKLEGLSDAELRRPMTKTSTNLIGIVKHLTGVTYGYLVSAFGRERETFPWEFDE